MKYLGKLRSNSASVDPLENRRKLLWNKTSSPGYVTGGHVSSRFFRDIRLQGNDDTGGQSVGNSNESAGSHKSDRSRSWRQLSGGRVTCTLDADEAVDHLAQWRQAASIPEA